MITKSRLALATDTLEERVARRAWDRRAKALAPVTVERDLSEYGFAFITIAVASISAFSICLFI